jgi:hypothetical protein
VPLDGRLTGGQRKQRSPHQAAAEPLTSRYTIDHPYGRLIGWSVITPRQGTVYECRWTGD